MPRRSAASTSFGQCCGGIDPRIFIMDPWPGRRRPRSRAISEALGHLLMMSRTEVMTELLHNVATSVKPITTKRSNNFATNRGMSTMGKRLAQARKAAGFRSAKSAAEALSTPVSTYNSHERAGEPGARNFGPDEAKIYGRRFNVTAAWLLTGEGDGLGGVPLVSWVSAGEMIAPDTVTDLSEAKRIPAPDLPKGSWIALRVMGDSMDRISPPESIIFVNRDDKRLVANACYVFADADGGATYKRFRPDPDRLEPVSTNPQHEVHYPDRIPPIIGRVRKTMLEM